MNVPSKCLTMLAFNNYHLSVGLISLIDTKNILMLDRIDWFAMRCGGSGGGITYVTRWLSCQSEASDFKYFEVTRYIERSATLHMKSRPSRPWNMTLHLIPDVNLSYNHAEKDCWLVDLYGPESWGLSCMPRSIHFIGDDINGPWWQICLARPPHNDITCTCTRVQSISITPHLGSIRSTPLTSICSQER